MTFYSKYNKIYAFLVIAWVSSVFSSLIYKVTEEPLIWADGIMLFCAIFIGSTLFTKYTIDTEKNLLHIRQSFIHLKVDISDLIKLREENTFHSAITLSSDRLAVICDKRGYVTAISPKDKKKFINTILQQNPNVMVQYKPYKNK